MSFSDPVIIEDKPKFNWKEFHNHYLVADAKENATHTDEQGKTSPVVVADVWIFDKRFELVRDEEDLWVFAKSLRRYLEPNIREKHPAAYRVLTADVPYKLAPLSGDDSARLLKAYREELGLPGF